ncbi:Bug family tripartite tricarboxylate transporter substrate binding protein [Achromobacter marplatensis]|uniref:Tripartite tricarboxylate transporter substrate-binding protein n=1 Tax=Achromobacter marplatensis TaxID=470868 RepID=A0AA42W9S1_9BURK|nr:tripartite tricarboxylate transporter substrate-binding protein [Achromobacter marplatensis]MDH2049674.1 tripartite tricarboxylate transporter substrate-binding protein [Achromobacter marplatensis]
MLLRRHCLAVMMLALTGWATGSHAQTPSQAWPAKPVRLVVGLAPGGLVDVLARTVQPHLAEALKQTVIVENRGGAGGNVAGAEVVRNGSDNHTFLLNPSTTESVNPLMFASMPFDPQRDLRPVALLANSQLFLFVRSSLGVDTLEAFVEYARKQPNPLNYGSAGNGTTPHLAGELLKQATGIQATHAPYRGVAPAIQDLAAGQIDFAFGPATVFPMVQSGKLKVLAVASRQRAAVAPDIRTFSEAGIDGVFADSLFGVYAAAGTRDDVVDRMNGEINKVLARPEIQARFLDAGAEALPLRAAEYAARVQDEKKLFAPLMKSLGLKEQ